MRHQKIDFIIVGTLHQTRENFYYNLARSFQEKGYKVCILTGCYQEYLQLKEGKICCFYLNQLIRVPVKTKNLKEKGRFIEKEYNIPSLNDFVFPEKCYYGEDEDYLIKKTIGTFERFEKLLSCLRPKCIIQNQRNKSYRIS